MRSEAQSNQSRINGAKSKGPLDTSRTRFNSLKHGLRAELVVIPGEDPAEFEADRAAFFDEWRPPSRTRALLVERLAATAWRLHRAVHAEAAHARAAADRAGRDFDDDQRARVDRDAARFDHDPMAALTLLESHAAGIDRMVRSWRGLAEWTGRGPSGWDRPEYHARLMILLGRRTDADPALAGPLAVASARMVDGERGGAEAVATVAGLRRLAAANLRRLRALRRQAVDPAEQRALAVAAASAVTTKGAELHHRYEMAHDRVLRGTIKQLMDLARSGADLADPDDPLDPADEGPPPPSAPPPSAEPTAAPAAPEAAPPGNPSIKPSASKGSAASGSFGAGPSGSFGAPAAGPVPTRSEAPSSGPEAPRQGRAKARRARSRR